MPFHSEAREDGVLVLPYGASREDMITTDWLQDYIQRNAPHWYQMVNWYSFGSYPNGSLVIVTRCDKTNDWANAAFLRKAKLDYNSQQMKKKFDTPWNFGIYVQEKCFQLLAARIIGCEIPVDVSMKRQSMVIRTLGVSLSTKMWVRTMPLKAPPLYSFVTQPRSLFQQLVDVIAVQLKLVHHVLRAISHYVHTSSEEVNPKYLWWTISTHV